MVVDEFTCSKSWPIYVLSIYPSFVLVPLIFLSTVIKLFALRSGFKGLVVFPIDLALFPLSRSVGQLLGVNSAYRYAFANTVPELFVPLGMLMWGYALWQLLSWLQEYGDRVPLRHVLRGFSFFLVFYILWIPFWYGGVP